jgi:hypothetical protein
MVFIWEEWALLLVPHEKEAKSIVPMATTSPTEAKGNQCGYDDHDKRLLMAADSNMNCRFKLLFCDMLH